MSETHPQSSELTELKAGTPILFGGNRILHVPDELAERFRPGDSVVVVEASEEILLIPAEEERIAGDAVKRAQAAFSTLAAASDEAISNFYLAFAERLADDSIWARIQEVNTEDVVNARARGRSTTRLVANEKLRGLMIEGLRGWVGAQSRRGQIIETVERDGWRTELVGAALGVVAFVFEGRPNVLADATGVLRGGNTVVFRIGSDALATARSIMSEALAPALRQAGLPEGCVVLVDSSTHAAGWALFGNRRLSLAVARGSGRAVATLGGLAQQAGVAVSLHGTGGAWLIASESTRAEPFSEAVLRSLDRKVCNTLNTCCIQRSRANELVPVLIGALERAGEALGQTYKLHVAESSRDAVPSELFEREVSVRRAEGDVPERQAQTIAEAELGHEWEWEQTPEISLVLVDDLDEAVDLCNRYSPRFVACLISEEAAEQERFYATVDAPFVGDGHTRWVDGQVALDRPELGLSNWQSGRLFGRGGILSGDTVYTVRTRAVGTSKPAPR
ncbi:MAG: aldehyde dehydrogenase family protein [Myxococcota bacterium]|nr:aldehyde dehydrogenase family protein [Myxococcota bacterium]